MHANAWTAWKTLPENRTAVLAVRRRVRRLEDEGRPASPLLIHGPSGCGKSFLLDCARESLADPLALDSLTGTAWPETLPVAKWIVLDDLHLLPKHYHERAGRAIETWRRRRVGLTFLSAKPPAEWGFSADLASRLLSGTILRIDPLGLESLAALIQFMARPLGMKLSRPARTYLASQSAASARAISATLTEMAAVAPIWRRADVAAWLERRERPDRLAEIVAAVAKTAGLSMAKLRGPSRLTGIRVARHMAMFLIRRLTDLPLQAVGRYFGNRDHATVRHAVMRMDALLAGPPSADADRLRALLARLGSAGERV